MEVLEGRTQAGRAASQPPAYLGAGAQPSKESCCNLPCALHGLKGGLEHEQSGGATVPGLAREQGQWGCELPRCQPMSTRTLDGGPMERQLGPGRRRGAGARRKPARPSPGKPAGRAAVPR